MSLEGATLGLFIATGALVLVTSLLVGVTYWHMKHARAAADSMEHIAKTMTRVADVMVREFEYRVSPLVDVRMGKLTIHGISPNSKLEFTITITNVGSRPCYVKNAKCVCSMRGQPELRTELPIRGFASETLLVPGVPDDREVRINGESWMKDQPRNYVLSVEMELAGEDRNYKSSVVELSKSA